ncbi:hypothetical protein [Verrucosispora sp. NA02020]|uniref:hypothetical protein n=1 Tax=Verrucosispora sp. NA02020 TaxID=2742132 RepID=UPI00159124DC|nr:hypothetical protein [Verrucosispora sp. NA02020]QKW17588.1 hypothetical protein HUT12_32280 [Verrucosispora sp. NA02020]
MPDCIPLVDPLCVPTKVAGNVAGRHLEQIAEEASKAAAEMLTTLVAGWLRVDRPEISETSGVVANLRSYTHWAVAAIAVGALLVGAIRLAIERNGREAGSIAKGLAALVVITGAGVPAVQVLITVGDSYSDWIITESTSEDLGGRLLLLSPAAGASTLSPIMLIGVSLFIFMAAMVQLLMLLAQNAGLILLAGLLPLPAAAAISGSGRAVLTRYLTWLIALILYKPAAATIYAATFWLGGQGQTLIDLLTGLVMLCMAIVALPALLRLIAPGVSVLSSGGGSSGAGVAAVSAAGQVASGAVRLSNSGGGQGGGRSGGHTGGGSGRPGGASPSAPSPRPSGGAPAAGGTSTGPGATGGAAAGSGAAAAAGPAGPVVASGVAAAQAGPAAVRRVGGTASGAVGGEGS